MSDIHVSEISKTFEVITEHVRNYDARRLLFDARTTKVDMQEEVVAPIISEFIQSLASTRIRKIARVESSSFLRETHVSKAFRENARRIQFKSFTEIELAAEWLEE
ncbi:hypothetical protein [Rufibacter sp. LB8]|uniref:hypothetical protein n=1 Tax=Rufibacter sp. LB8 TaxID=2777781 RepID=UPI00178C531A|nr:hypothetical protein [Rufibacter sp. LB8]